MRSRYDLTGEKSGTLIAKKYIGNSKWLCICQVCQNEVEITTNKGVNELSIVNEYGKDIGKTLISKEVEGDTVTNFYW